MLTKLIIGLLDIYKTYISPALPVSCCFWPSCSQYARGAILKYGILKGGYKGLKRLICCHPFSGKSGYDPVK
ncbi:membrane protein insertion efficiency factor YidD [bacterium]|nr:MAG: membrane protein insertion efficiency factor YidD [bacterium]